MHFGAGIPLAVLPRAALYAHKNHFYLIRIRLNRQEHRVKIPQNRVYFHRRFQAGRIFCTSAILPEIGRRHKSRHQILSR